MDTSFASRVAEANFFRDFSNEIHNNKKKPKDKRECDNDSKEEFWFELVKQGYTLRNKYGYFYLKGPKRWWSFFHVPDIYEITPEFYLLIAGSRYDKRK